MGRVKADYVLKKRNRKTFIIFAVIYFSVLLLIELTLAYNYLSYVSVSQSTDFPAFKFIYSCFYFGQSWLPFSLNVIKECFVCIGKVWYINVLFVLSLFLITRKRGKFAGVEYGSQRWMNREERRQFELKQTTGVIPVADRILIDPSNHPLPNINEIVLGSSGSGKSFNKLIPDIMYQFGNYIITDVKGDLFKFLYKILTMNGYDVRVLNLDNLKYSNGFNPIEYCETDTDIDKLVNTFVVNSRREGASVGEAIWEDTLSMLLFATVKYIIDKPNEDKTFYRCLQLASSIALEQGSVSPSCEIERLMMELELKDPYNSAVLNWKLVKQAAPETLQSVIISMTSRLRLWANEDLRILTQEDDLGLDDLADANKKVAIFLIVPEGDRTYNCISSMFISTAIQRLKSLAKNQYNGSLPKLVSFELDEFANTGILPNWDEVVSTIRSQNIRVMMVLQDLEQLKKNYEKSHSTIRTNCAIFNYLGTSEEKTTEMISKRLGKTTIDHQNTSYSSETFSNNRGNIQNQEMGRELLTQAEVEGLPENRCIVFLERQYPIFGKKFKTDQHPLFEYLGHNKGPHQKNNTDPKEVYEELYEQRKAQYLAFLETKKAHTVDVFSGSAAPKEKTLDADRIFSDEQNELAFQAFEEAAAMEYQEPYDVSDFKIVDDDESQSAMEEFEAAYTNRFGGLKDKN